MTHLIAGTEVGERLRAIRTLRGLKLYEVAPHIKTDAGSLSRIERGHRDPSLAQLRALAALYRVSLADIFGQSALRRSRAA
jgi:transcriptional regulator with XRE-family HTH domain